MSERVARRAPSPAPAAETEGAAHGDAYRLDDQIGFLLRRASQRHLAIFAAGMAGATGKRGEPLTPMQWAALAKLHELGTSAQTSLGRATAMDAATIKGVVDRLEARGLVATQADPMDGRRRRVSISASGRRLVAEAVGHADRISEETLAPLGPAERSALIALLRRIM